MACSLGKRESGPLESGPSLQAMSLSAPEKSLSRMGISPRRKVKERSGGQPRQPFDRVGLRRRLVGADARDSRKTHGEPRFVALAGVDRIEGDLEHERLLHL